MFPIISLLVVECGYIKKINSPSDHHTRLQAIYQLNSAAASNIMNTTGYISSLGLLLVSLAHLISSTSIAGDNTTIGAQVLVHAKNTLSSVTQDMDITTDLWEAALLNKTEPERRELAVICRHMAMYDLLFAAIAATNILSSSQDRFKREMNSTAVNLCKIWVSIVN